MKKYFRIVFCMLVAVSASMCVVSCGDDDDEEVKPEETIVNGVDLSLLPGYYEFNGNIAPSFELRKDGTCRIISSSTGNETEDKWSYEKSNCVLLVGTHVYVVQLLTEDGLAAEWTSVKYGVSISSWKRYSFDVKEIQLSSTSLDMIVGKSETLTATVLPSNAMNRSVKWISSDESVAKVSSEGNVTAVTVGTATITCTSVSNGDVKAICKVTVGKIPVTKIEVPASLTIDIDERKRISYTIYPSDATDKTLVWSSSNTAVATVDGDGYVTGKKEGKTIVTCTSKDDNKIMATCEVTVKKISYEPTAKINGHGYVDLGLPSGTKWATCNVGASSPEDYGDYFAWGETTGYNSGKTYFWWSYYKWCRGSEKTMTKYCTKSSYGTVDNKTELDLEDDAARANWGGTWRMPSKAQQDELRSTSNCYWKWTTLNGKYGYRVTSRRNGNSIFLPAAGYRNDGTLDFGGSNGRYWSRSLYTSYSDNAYNLDFYSSGVYWDSDYRGGGRSVRAVSE